MADLEFIDIMPLAQEDYERGMCRVKVRRNDGRIGNVLVSVLEAEYFLSCPEKSPFSAEIMRQIKDKAEESLAYLRHI